jgi:hypothetical protein
MLSRGDLHFQDQKDLTASHGGPAAAKACTAVGTPPQHRLRHASRMVQDFNCLNVGSGAKDLVWDLS